MKRDILLAAAIGLAGAGFGPSQAAAQDQKLLIGSTASASSHYGYFVAVTQLINDKVDGVDASVVETGATVDNLRRISRDQIDLGLVTTTKSGFFYHFRDKGALATALLERYLAREEALFDDLFERADTLNEDPLHGFLVGLKMLADMMSDLPNGHPGCLVAAVCYQENLFNRTIHELNAEATGRWRRRFRARFDAIAESHPPRVAVDFDDLADMLSVLVDGGIIVSKVMREPQALGRQILLYRAFVRTVFLGA